MGRPKGPPRKRVCRFELRLSKKELAALMDLAQDGKTTASGWVQRQIRYGFNALVERRERAT